MDIYERKYTFESQYIITYAAWTEKSISMDSLYSFVNYRLQIYLLEQSTNVTSEKMSRGTTFPCTEIAFIAIEKTPHRHWKKFHKNIDRLKETI